MATQPQCGGASSAAWGEGKREGLGRLAERVLAWQGWTAACWLLAELFAGPPANANLCSNPVTLPAVVAARSSAGELSACGESAEHEDIRAFSVPRLACLSLSSLCRTVPPHPSRERGSGTRAAPWYPSPPFNLAAREPRRRRPDLAIINFDARAGRGTGVSPGRHSSGQIHCGKDGVDGMDDDAPELPWPV